MRFNCENAAIPDFPQRCWNLMRRKSNQRLSAAKWWNVLPRRILVQQHGLGMLVSAAPENQIAKDNGFVVGLVTRGKDER